MEGYFVGALGILSAATILLVLILSIAHNIAASDAGKYKATQACIEQGYSGYDSVIGCFGGSRK